MALTTVQKQTIVRTEEFILACCQLRCDAAARERARQLLQQGIDWDFFFETILPSGLYLFFLKNLTALDSSQHIPRNILELLKTKYYYAVSLAGIQHQETKQILGLFNKNNIPIVVLKGPLLAQRLYGDIAARGGGSDIDLLVREGDKERACKVLEEVGYVRQKRNLEPYEWQYVFSKQDAFPLDLHWTINPYRRPPYDAIPYLWEHLQAGMNDDFRYQEFDHESSLLYLSVHFVLSLSLTHVLRYACDINETIMRYKNFPDWSGLIAKAQQLRLCGSLYAGLVFAKKLYHAPVPEEVMEKLPVGRFQRILLAFLTDNRVLFHKNSFRRNLLHRFLKDVLFQVIEAKSFKDYGELLGNVLRLFVKKTAKAFFRFSSSRSDKPKSCRAAGAVSCPGVR